MHLNSRSHLFHDPLQREYTAVHNPDPGTLKISSTYHLTDTEAWALRQLRKFCETDEQWVLAISQGVQALVLLQRKGFELPGEESTSSYPPPDPWSDATDVNPDFGEIAREAEELLRQASTPNVRQPITVNDSPTVVEAPKFNLFEQNFVPLQSLHSRAPHDPLIREFWKQFGAKKEEELTKAEKIAIRSLEVAYEILPVDMWGTETARFQLKSLQLMHRE